MAPTWRAPRSTGRSPIRALSALRRRIPYLDSAGFLRELTLLINRLRDQHTQLYVDAADRHAHTARRGAALFSRALRLAPLPDLRRRTKRATTSTTPTSRSAPTLRPGTASRSPGPSTSTPRPSGADARTPRRARALATFTQRPLAYLPPPEELWVEDRLPTRDGPAPGDPDRSVRFEWRAMSPPAPSPPTTESRCARAARST